ncbi:NADase-type glycan-binding domain-containing protein [Actinomadura oligospora]|uniref:NADase-type glycan-binding domain-containing protein n=1 Tax=Actinomadura oligospora TaxID=111804 RepID=UPI00047C4B64|nr:hypothetical protein [Actinomadura oligospora]
MTTKDACPDCGAPGQSGSFCDICGAVLDWSNPAPAKTPPPARPATPPAAKTPPPAATPPPAPPRTPPPATPTLPEPPNVHPESAPPNAPTGRRFAPEPEPDRADSTEPSPPKPDAASPPAATHSTPPEDAAERARRLLVPVADQQPPAPANPHVAPVLPGRPEQARPHIRQAEEMAVVGGVICPWCDTANPRERHFCRKCAMSLVSADPSGPRTRSWWRRILRPDDSEAPWAGERPRLRRGLNRALATTIAAALGLTAVGVGVAYADNAVNGVYDHFAKRVPVSVSDSKASHSDPSHGPRMAFDGLADTWWGDGYGGSGAGQFLESTFGQPTDLLNVIITPGVSKQPDQYARQGRPQILAALITTSDGGTTTKTLRLDDAAGPQKLPLRAHKVTRIRLTIQAAYGAGPNVQVGISEIEFFGRSFAGTR